jgi:hypothetical protein
LQEVAVVSEAEPEGDYQPQNDRHRCKASCDFLLNDNQVGVDAGGPGIAVRTLCQYHQHSDYRT